MPSNVLFTTGYAGYSGQDFLWKVKTYGIEVVVDVRGNPVSRNAAFSQGRLMSLLKGGGVEYVHFQALGVPARMRRVVRNGQDLSRYLKRYRAYLETQTEGLDRLGELAARRSCCLLCLETNPGACHRSVLAEVIAKRQANGIKVEHI